MRRSSERLIDVLVLFMLLSFAWMMREPQPGLAGVIVAASIQFWMQKNASAPQPTLEEAAAKAAAAVLQAAERKASEEYRKNLEPTEVEIVGQSDTVDVEVVKKNR